MKSRFFASTLLLLVSVLSGCASQPSAPVYLNSGKVLPTNLPFSEAVLVGNTVYFSGQIGNLPGTLKLAPGGIAGEATPGSHRGVDPAIFVGVKLVKTIEREIADLVAPAASPGAIGQLGAQNVRGQPNLVGIDKEKLPATAHRRHQIGHNAAGLGAGGVAQIGLRAIELVGLERRGSAATQQGNRTFDLLAIKLLHHRIDARELSITTIGKEPKVTGALAHQRLFHCLQTKHRTGAIQVIAAGCRQAVDRRGDAIGVELIFKDLAVGIALMIKGVEIKVNAFGVIV